MFLPQTKIGWQRMRMRQNIQFLHTNFFEQKYNLSTTIYNFSTKSIFFALNLKFLHIAELFLHRHCLWQISGFLGSWDPEKNNTTKPADFFINLGDSYPDFWPVSQVPSRVGQFRNCKRNSIFKFFWFKFQISKQLPPYDKMGIVYLNGQAWYRVFFSLVPP